MKKILSIILAILMVVTMLPMAVMPASAATPTPYDGVPVTPQQISSSNYAKLGLTSSNWSQFNGYYAIRNAKELYGFAAVTRSSSTANAVLLQDIVVNANGGTTYNWTPIAHQSNVHAYEGIFDGNGHYISGLYSTTAITRPGRNYSDCGFICNLYGTVKNLVIKNSTFAPGIDIGVHGGLGAITGYPFGCTIQNCRVENITLKSINDGGQLGGIAGYGDGGSSTIKNCVSINVTFSGGKYTNSIAPNAPYSSCYTSATASHNCTKLSVEHKEVKATCEYPGLSNYKYCLVCGKVTSGTKTETPATGHTLKSATCIAPKTCTICGATEGSVDNTAHSWANNDGICANGCGATCPHENQTGSVCEICGAELHVCSNYNNGFCTGCDAYEPAELKDGYYQIKNGGNLFWYANYINTVDRTANAVLTADIDLENRPWTPIGSTGENSNNFRGIFDGQNYTIKGLYAEGGRAGLGFFGEVRTGTVKNFTIFGEVVVNTEVDYVGGVIGSVCGVNGETDLERNGAIIQNIRSFVNLTAKAHGVGMIGGFVGYANHQSLIENCSWYGTFDAGEYRVDSGAGGFIGKIRENTSEVTIRNCGAYGTIKTNYAKNSYNNTPTIYMGGFLSFSNTNAQTTLENCLFAGKFERGENLTDEALLGAFGTLRSVNAIKNCYYLGDDGLEAVHSDSSLKPGSDNVEITKVTEEQLKSGEIAYKLQEANEIWGQSIGTDAYPVLGGEDVYCGYTACDDEAMVYTNDSTVSATKPDHSWGEGVLTRPTKTAEGYYTYTCSACGKTKTEPVERAANYDDYTKALEDLRAYLDSDMLTDENKSYISEWLAMYDTDEVYSFIAGEEETLQEYIDATAYYASEFEAAIQECLAGNHSGNGETCEICGAYIHECDFSGEWKYDADKHWKECTVDGCDKISEESEHSFIDGKCACGYACPHDSYTDGVCDNCEYACPHENVTGATCRTPVKCDVCGYSVFDWTNHEGEYVNGFCPNCDDYEPAVDSDSDGYYEIGNAGQLYWFADKAKNDRTNYGSANAILTQNIVVNENVLTADGKLNGFGSDFRAWIPPYAYRGTFDGAGKTVSGLYFKDTEERNVGFIGYLNGGTVKNLTVKDSYFNAYSDVGGIVGSVYKGTVADCFSSATVIAGSLGYAGGIAGENGAGLVERCANSGFVTSGYEAGGIVGCNLNYYDDPDPAIIRHCYNIGSVSGYTVGGIVGYAIQQMGSSVEIDSCWAACELNGTNSVGGLIGFASGSTIRCCSYDKTVFTGNAVGKKTSCNTLDSGFKSTEEFASGEAAYLLNGKSSGGFWRQTIGTDTYPGFSGDKVYYGYISCADNAKKVYTNDATATEVKPAHNWSNNDGICANGCGYECTHVSYTGGVCDNCNYECPHAWGEGVLTRPTFETEGYYTYTCTLCGHSYTESVNRADSAALNDASIKITEYIDNDTLTQEARDEIYNSYRDILKNNGNIFDEFGFVRGDLIEEEQPIIDAITAELEKIIADADEKIASGEYVKIDGMKEYNKIADALDAELMENYSQEEFAALAEKAGDEINARFGEIIEKAEALTGSVAENKDALAEIESEMRALYAEMKNCLDGVHNGFVYEVTEEAKCEANAIESATCTLCGETDEREIEGTALTHSFTKYEETEAPKCGIAGKEVANCDNGCGATDEKEIAALEHIFVDYASNGDATCTSDGTKTAKCERGCGATDTVTDEGTILDHADKDGDKVCDDCGAEVVDLCPECGRPVHENEGIPQYICLIIMLIKLVVKLVKTLQGIAA